MTTLTVWEKEFSKVTASYVSKINWERVIFNDGEVAQASDDLQLEAFQNICDSGEEQSLSEWEFYDDSCESRTDFSTELEEKWQEAFESRDEA